MITSQGILRFSCILRFLDLICPGIGFLNFHRENVLYVHDIIEQQ